MEWSKTKKKNSRESDFAYVLINSDVYRVISSAPILKIYKGATNKILREHDRARQPQTHQTTQVSVQASKSVTIVNNLLQQGSHCAQIERE